MLEVTLSPNIKEVDKVDSLLVDKKSSMHNYWNINFIIFHKNKRTVF